jgi:hypothetical protein
MPPYVFMGFLGVVGNHMDTFEELVRNYIFGLLSRALIPVVII